MIEVSGLKARFGSTNGIERVFMSAVTWRRAEPTNQQALGLRMVLIGSLSLARSNWFANPSAARAGAGRECALWDNRAFSD